MHLKLRNTYNYFWILSLVVLTSCLPKPLANNPGKPEWGLQVTWHGQSCFTLRDSVGRTVVFDPFDETVGYGHIYLRADVLLITHAHFDHNFKQAVKARSRNLELMDSSGTQTMAGEMAVTGIESYHDKKQGQIHGPNRMYSLYMGGLRVVHMGDFGEEKISKVQLAMMGSPDVLFIPVGGVTTIGPAEAKAIVDQLKPKAVFPMHYGDIRFFKLADIKDFTKLFPSNQVHFLDDPTVRLTTLNMGSKPVIYVLSPTPKNY